MMSLASAELATAAIASSMGASEPFALAGRYSVSSSSLVKLAGIRPTDAAWSILESGPKLGPSDVRLFIALNCDSSQGLVDTLTIVREHHGLRIDVVVLGPNGLRRVDI